MASKSQLSCEFDFFVQPALGWAHIAGAPLNKFGGQRFEREGNGGWRKGGFSVFFSEMYVVQPVQPVHFFPGKYVVQKLAKV